MIEVFFFKTMEEIFENHHKTNINTMLFANLNSRLCTFREDLYHQMRQQHDQVEFNIGKPHVSGHVEVPFSL